MKIFDFFFTGAYPPMTSTLIWCHKFATHFSRRSYKTSAQIWIKRHLLVPVFYIGNPFLFHASDCWQTGNATKKVPMVSKYLIFQTIVFSISPYLLAPVLPSRFPAKFSNFLPTIQLTKFRFCFLQQNRYSPNIPIIAFKTDLYRRSNSFFFKIYSFDFFQKGRNRKLNFFNWNSIFSVSTGLIPQIKVSIESRTSVQEDSIEVIFFDPGFRILTVQRFKKKWYWDWCALMFALSFLSNKRFDFLHPLLNQVFCSCKDRFDNKPAEVYLSITIPIAWKKSKVTGCKPSFSVTKGFNSSIKVSAKKFSLVENSYLEKTIHGSLRRKPDSRKFWERAVVFGVFVSFRSCYSVNLSLISSVNNRIKNVVTCTSFRFKEFSILSLDRNPKSTNSPEKA